MNSLCSLRQLIALDNCKEVCYSCMGQSVAIVMNMNSQVFVYLAMQNGPSSHIVMLGVT